MIREGNFSLLSISNNSKRDRNNTPEGQWYFVRVTLSKHINIKTKKMFSPLNSKTVPESVNLQNGFQLHINRLYYIYI